MSWVVNKKYVSSKFFNNSPAEVTLYESLKTGDVVAELDSIAKQIHLGSDGRNAASRNAYQTLLNLHRL